MESSLRNYFNFYNEFKPWYLKIKKDFGFKFQKDCKSRDYLSEVLRKKENWDINENLTNFKKYIESKEIILVYGCGPTLESTVQILIKKKGKEFFNKVANLVADGASVLLKSKNLPINGLFTDLDGITRKEMHYSEYIFVHAHGDNLKKLKYFEDDIIKLKNIIPTTQVDPVINIINPGGFTDGDRILFFLRPILKPKHQLFLIGMDFSNIVGKYSKLAIKKDQEASSVKIKKLNYAVKLIEWIKNYIDNEINLINSKPVSNQFNYISIDEFIKLV